MCLYARDVSTGEVPGPYDDAAAELYARCLLIPDDSFDRGELAADEALARNYRVPPEQISAKRTDLAASDARGADPRPAAPTDTEDERDGAHGNQSDRRTTG